MLEKTLSEVERKIGNIVKAITNWFFQESFKIEVTELEQEKLKHQTRLLELQDRECKPVFTEDMFRALVTNFHKLVRERNLSECKKFLQRYVQKVVVFPDRVEVIYTMATSLFEGEEGFTT